MRAAELDRLQGRIHKACEILRHLDGYNGEDDCQVNSDTHDAIKLAYAATHLAYRLVGAERVKAQGIEKEQG